MNMMRTTNFPTPGHPPNPPASAPGSNYFAEQKKGEVNELLNLLRQVSTERETKKKREVVKKAITYMTLGIDVSRLFSEMVKCVDTRDIILKKMVYLYLTTYARKNSDLAIMCINTLLNDCQNEDPMVRGLALRSLCGLRLDSILEYIHEPLQNSLTDASAYVRKTGVIGILKVFSLNQQIIKDSDMIDTLYNMLRDRDPQVVSNCIVALNEIMATEGGMAINQQIIMHLLNRITEYNEWGQCTFLELLSKYEPQDQDETFKIMNILEQCLRVSSSAVVLGAIKCFLELTSELPEIQSQVYQRMRQPLLTLLAGGSHEVNYTVLHHIHLMIQRCPGVFNPDYRQFYARYNEPTYIKYIKIEIMSEIADEINVSDLVTELSEYVTDVDQEMARLAIQAIAKIAVTLEEAAHQIFDALTDFLEMDMDYVRCQTMIVMKDLLRKFPDDRGDVLPILPRIIKNVDEEEGKCAIIWMIGEFGEELRRAPYILEPLIDAFAEETSSAVMLELLSAAMKLFFKRPPEMQGMLGRLLEAAIMDTRNQDVHDRALLYYRLLEHNVHAAASVVNCVKDPIAVFAEMTDNDVQERLFREFNSLSIVYNKPSETFIKPVEVEDEEEEEDEGAYEDEHESPQDQDDYYPEESHPAPEQSAGSDLLDMDFNGGAPPPPDAAASPRAFGLNPTPHMDAGLFQQQWSTLPVLTQCNVQIPVLPAQAEIEGRLSQNGIVTMASGDVGTHFKFFFYAQDLHGNYYLVESMFDKSTCVLSATIKGDGSVDAGGFTTALQQALL